MLLFLLLLLFCLVFVLVFVLFCFLFCFVVVFFCFYVYPSPTLCRVTSNFFWPYYDVRLSSIRRQTDKNTDNLNCQPIEQTFS